MKKRISPPSEDNLYTPLKILDEKKSGSSKQYLILWKGYSQSEATWEPLKSIKHCSYLFDEWEQKKEKSLQKDFENIEELIQKKFGGSRAIYLAKWKNKKADSWVCRRDLKVKYSSLISEYERKYGGASYKRKHQEISSSEDEQENHFDESSQKYSFGETTPDQHQNKQISILESDEEEVEEDERISTRRIIKVKKLNDHSENKQLNDAIDKQNQDILPLWGIFGVDVPESIINMSIDKRVGKKEDQYFSCDVKWKARSNKCYPLDSRISRQDIKDNYPLLLISFYEENITYQGEVIEEDANEDGNDDEDSISFGYVKQLNTSQDIYKSNQKKVSFAK